MFKEDPHFRQSPPLPSPKGDTIIRSSRASIAAFPWEPLRNPFGSPQETRKDTNEICHSIMGCWQFRRAENVSKGFSTVREVRNDIPEPDGYKQTSCNFRKNGKTSIFTIWYFLLHLNNAGSVQIFTLPFDIYNFAGTI